MERIAIFLEDINTPGIVSCKGFTPRLGHLSCHSCQIWTAENLLIPANAPLRWGQGLHPSDPAYVIYTSGLTGKTEGIEINQCAIYHFLRSENATLDIAARDRIYQEFSVAFDMSFEEIWISYLVGAPRSGSHSRN